jgi:hypothetical protein
MKTELKSKAVLMRLTLGMPGETRTDRDFTDKVITEKGMGVKSGKWNKSLYPDKALKQIKKLDGEIRKYHNAVTLPFDSGIGILPCALIQEYSDRMRDFAAKRKVLVKSDFLDRYDEWVEWARVAHNGTFDPELYPGVDEIREKFYMETSPIPIPDCTHYEDTVASLLGTDLDSINRKVEDAGKEAQRELMRRLIEPVKKLSSRMVEIMDQANPIVYESLTGNIKDISELAPKLNLSGDPAIDQFAKDMKQLSLFTKEEIKSSKAARIEARDKADAMLTRLEGYRI